MKAKITKITNNMEVEDITSKWRNKNRLIWFLFGVSLTLSTIIVHRSIYPVVYRSLEQDNLMIKMYDSMSLKLKIISYRDSNLNERNLYEYTRLIGCTHPYETTAQALFETGGFSRGSSASMNNLFGFKDHRGYIGFKHWTYSVDFMINSYQSRNGLEEGMNYYQWLPKSYHQSDRKAYTQGVHYLELKLKQKYK